VVTKISIETGEIITMAKYQWKYLAGSIVRIFTDEDMNSGEPQIFNYTEKNIANLEKSMKKKINSALMKDGSQHALAMSGINKYVVAVRLHLQLLVELILQLNLGGETKQPIQLVTILYT